MPKNQTGNHTTVPKVMGKGPKYPFAFYVALVLSMTVGAAPVLAAGDPLAVINNLSTFIFSLIRAIGLILLGFGVVHDPVITQTASPPLPGQEESLPTPFHFFLLPNDQVQDLFCKGDDDASCQSQKSIGSLAGIVTF